MYHLSHHYHPHHHRGKDFSRPTCAQPVWGLLESGSACAHGSPSTPTSLAAEEGPRRDQTVRQPHSRRMRHTWEVTCLAHQPTCRHSSFTDPQADLGFESSLWLCDHTNGKSMRVRALTYDRGRATPASRVTLGALLWAWHLVGSPGLITQNLGLPSPRHSGSHISPS